MVCLSEHLCCRSSVSLLRIHYPYALQGVGYERVNVATKDAGLDIERLRASSAWPRRDQVLAS